MWDGSQPVNNVPVRRDVMMVNTNASSVWHYTATNPGVYLIHCHIEWHVEAGLIATIIEAPNLLQGRLTIPADHIAACKSGGIPTVGNAAGNDADWLNLTGAPMVPPEYDYGSLVDPPPGLK